MPTGVTQPHLTTWPEDVTNGIDVTTYTPHPHNMAQISRVNHGFLLNCIKRFFTRCITFYYNLYPEIMLNRVFFVFRNSCQHCPAILGLHTLCIGIYSVSQRGAHTQPSPAVTRCALLIAADDSQSAAKITSVTRWYRARIVYLLAISVMTSFHVQFHLTNQIS